jgi:flagellar protein FliO/FliZ
VTPSVWPSLLAFIVVLAAIPFVLSLLKRAQTVRGSGQSQLQLTAALSVGPRERIAIVRTGERWLVVGITAQAISLLTTLDAPPPGMTGREGSASVSPSPFANLLSHVRNKNGSPRR